MADQEKRRGRPAKGSVTKGTDGRWTVRLTIPGTKRTKRIKLGPEIRTEARAREVALYWHEKLRDDPELLSQATGGKAMTCGQYLQKWTEHRRGRLVCAEQDHSDMLLHVFDDHRLLDKPAASVTSDDLRAVVAKIDGKVREGIIRATTAAKLWSKIRSLFSEMAESKVPALRIRDDNPVVGVRAPDKGNERDKAILYPDEAAKLFACPALTVDERRFWALLFYTGLRVSELLALRWASVDLDHRQIHVHQSGAQRVKSTKTGKGREVHIVPALVPLLEAMRSENPEADRIFSRLFTDPAIALRDHLWTAGVRREALHTTDATRRRIRAQDARASTATWLGILMQLPDAGEARTGRRVEPFLIKDWLGHEDLKTTERHYLRGRGLRIEHVGEPFGALPDDLTGGSAPIFCQSFLHSGGRRGGNRRQHRQLGAALRSRTDTARSRNPGTCRIRFSDPDR